jgi:CheY-like chemotaxis protein
MIVVLEDNLMFSLAMQEIATALGESVEVVGTPQALVEAMRQPDITGVVLDMRLVSDEVWPHLSPKIPLAAFGPHVEGAQFARMREHGIRDVWPHSRLRERFSEWVQRIRG